jgi:Ion channel
MLTESIVALLLIGICVVFHCGGILVIGAPLVHRRREIERRAGTVHSAVLLTWIFAALMFLHVVENCIWAAFYYGLGLFGNYETALYFSLGTYTAIGYGDVLLPQKWRLLGTLEGISGVLLCGLSTAFLFTVVNALFQFRIQRMNLGNGSAPTSPEIRTNFPRD